MGALSGSNFLQALGWAVLNSLWQMAFLWVAYQILSGTFVKKAASRNFLATLLLTGGFAWFIYSFISLLQFDEPASVPGLTALTVNDAVNDWFFTALPVASVIYLTFLILPFWNFVRSYRYVRIIRRQGLHRAGVEWRLFVARVSQQMGIGKEVQVWLSEFVSSPVTIGYFKPIILLPVAALNQLTTQQTEAILLHELSHIKRFDYLINLTIKLIQAILYFNPFVKAFATIIEEEREKTCDNTVLQFQYEPHGYASALLALEREARQLQVLTIPASSGKKSQLLHRIESIMGIRKNEGFSPMKMLRTGAGIVCCFFFLVLVMLSHPVKVKIAEDRLSSYFSPFLVFPTEERPVSISLAENNTPLNHSAGSLPDAGNIPVAPVVPDENADQGDSIEEHITDQSFPIFASFDDQNPVPEPAELNKAQLEQVRVAVDASRKVLEEIKWKAIETNIADAMTMAQKEVAKEVFKQDAEKQDWEKMEHKLKTSYEKIDWAEINKNLSNAMVQIKYDSLQYVYNVALTGLNELQKTLDKTETKAIPDTDITISAVIQKQELLKVAAETLKKAKTKKIIQL
ncbi:MAG: M56 family metallopeptidase [Chitinophagaceae bacterium]